MKAYICFLFCFLLFAPASFTQIKINYGVTFGLSRNFKNYSSDTYTPQLFNNKTINKTRGYTSPVIGLNADVQYKLLYASIGFEFNKVKASYYNFNERGYNTLDANNNLEINKYYDESTSTHQYSKLNIPLVIGIKILNKYDLSPFIFGGINLNYLLNGKINTSENFQDPKTKNITTRETPINVFDKNDNYEFLGFRKLIQKLFGIGVQYRKHIAVKASIRSQLFLNVMEKSDPSVLWECFVYSKSYNSKEYVLTLQYHF